MPTIVQDESLTPGQFRAARALLGFSLVEASRRAKVCVATVAMAEKEVRIGHDQFRKAIQAAYEQAGVRFLNEAQSGWGVILGPGRAPPDRGPWASLR